MVSPNLPNDDSSLLVPVHLEAWVVSPFTRNQTPLARYTANYGNLANFKCPIPDPFETSSGEPDDGIHLHWALPDALTHGRENSEQKGWEFPTAPNRWLVARFNTAATWQAKLWVVKSDQQDAINLGTTTGDFTAKSVEIDLAAPGLTIALGANQPLELVPAGQGNRQRVLTAAAAAAGAIKVQVQAIPSLADQVSAGATLHVPTTSAFLDPSQPTSAKVQPMKATLTTIRKRPIGVPFCIEAWEAHTEQDDQDLFLSAVGPGNVSFAAFAPFSENVFSFVDRDLPAPKANQDTFCYMVVGWYSNPLADPVRACEQYAGIPAFWQDLWESQEAWTGESPIARFKTLMDHMKWSTSKADKPPSSSLYHATLPGVVWAFQPATTGAPIDPQDVQVAVGNTGIDALSALIAADNDNDAGKNLAQLFEAAQHDLLSEFDQPGGQARIEQSIHKAWFGSEPGGILWEVVAAPPEDSAQDARKPTLTDAQQSALQINLAELNAAQREYDVAQRELASLQADLYTLWWKVGKANSGGVSSYDPGTFYPSDRTPQWGPLKSSLQRDLYPGLFQEVWEKTCALRAQLQWLPDPTKAEAAQDWADNTKKWRFPGTPSQQHPHPKQTDLTGLGLRLKSSAMPRFFHPNDPVVLIRGLNRSRKHGEDGRDSNQNQLLCRLPKETITGVQVAKQPGMHVAALEKAGVQLVPTSGAKNIPVLTHLVQETFFVDPANAPLIAKAVGGDAKIIEAAIGNLIAGKADAAKESWIGKPPVPFAMTPWEQAWSPLFLEWEAHFFPTGKGQAAERRFQLEDWIFDGAQYVSAGTNATMKEVDGVQVESGSGFDPDYFVSFSGRSHVAPQTPALLQKKIHTYLADHPKIGSPELENLLRDVAQWDLLTQSISGFTQELLTLESVETFPPPPCDDKVLCPTTARTPSITALVGGQYRAVPQLVAPEDQRFGNGRNHFYPVRGGFLQFQKLRVVDTFGQAHELDLTTTVPIPAQGLQPTGVAPKGLPAGTIQLPPRIPQASRLDFHWLANDGSGTELELSRNPNAICGWLLPNHLDGAIAVYDSDGVALGELYPPPYGWRPRPGASTRSGPPQDLGDISNEVLRKVLQSIAKASKTNPKAFGDFLSVVDETLWMIDPLGGRKDDMLSVLIGRPLAVAQVRVGLEWCGPPAFDQLWQKMMVPAHYIQNQNAKPPFVRNKDTGGIDSLSFPVRLGSLQLRNDGLLGYFQTSPEAPHSAYDTFYTVHETAEVSSQDSFIRQIRKPDPQAPTGWSYQGDLHLRFPQPQNPTADGQPVDLKPAPVTLTLLVDPRGRVHANSAILPTKSIALPGHGVEDLIKKLAVTFRAGPILAPPGPLRTPLPATLHGQWSWIQRTAPNKWEEGPIENADDRARLPKEPPGLREGWLKYKE